MTMVLAFALSLATTNARVALMHCLNIASAFSLEVQHIRNFNFGRGTNEVSYFCSAKIIMFITVITYVLEDKTLNAVDIYITFGLFTNIRSSLTLYVPFGVQVISETLVSLKRVQVLLFDINIYLFIKYNAQLCNKTVQMRLTMLAN